jgi:hypothetical protein
MTNDPRVAAVGIACRWRVGLLASGSDDGDEDGGSHTQLHPNAPPGLRSRPEKRLARASH